jgi:hypothetical protein
MVDMIILKEGAASRVEELACIVTSHHPTERHCMRCDVLAVVSMKITFLRDVMQCSQWFRVTCCLCLQG